MTASWTVLAGELAEPGRAVARLRLLNPGGLIALVADPALTGPARPGAPVGRTAPAGPERSPIKRKKDDKITTRRDYCGW